MTPDKPNRRTGLDQLEPVLGEVVAHLDLHTAQLRRANLGIATLIETTSRQTDDISFLLRGQADQREQIARLTVGQTEMKAELTELKAGQTMINQRLDNVGERLDGFGQTLTAILNAVQKPSGN